MRFVMLCPLMLVAALTFLAIAPAPAGSHPAEPPDDADLPAARDLIEQARKAAGGLEALAKVRSLAFDSSIESNGRARHSSIRLMPPLLIALEEVSPTGQRFQVFSDGEWAWVNVGGGGQQTMPVDQLGEFVPVFGLHFFLSTVDDLYTDFKTIEKTQLHDQPTYRVELVRKSDRKTISVYFHRETGRLAGWRHAFTTGPVEFFVSAVITEWIRQGDVELIKRMVLMNSQDEGRPVARNDNIVLNEVNPKIFEKPETVLRQIEALKQAAAEGAPPVRRPGQGRETPRDEPQRE